MASGFYPLANQCRGDGSQISQCRPAAGEFEYQFTNSQPAMNSPITPQFISSLTQELRSYITLCEEILGLITQENKALAGQATYNHSEFYQKRKNLLPNIDLLLAKLR